jgi:hypothetical protein
MTKVEQYQEALIHLEEWDDYLLKQSGLPGPRGNIELAQAVANKGNRELFERYLRYTAEIAPVNSPYEFLAFCGALGFGRLLAEGETGLMVNLSRIASDPRWRMREAVAMALQRLGEVDMAQLIDEMNTWCNGTFLEQRAAAAALCEPRLLTNPEHVRQVLAILDTITGSIEKSTEQRGDDFDALRKGLGYCWSVAVAALPEEGKQRMEKWLVKSNKHIRWIMQENLKKNRLIRMDAGWVNNWRKSKAKAN